VHRFWDSAVLPLLQARSPKTIIEVGAAQGKNTRLVASWAAEHDAVLHVIDPKPKFDVEAYTKDWAGHLAMRLELSLSALPAIGPVDLILLDGDHNWYTMLGELQAIDRVNPDWPLVIMHDVGWPYGRRDLYYDPATIPAEHRQPYRRAGIQPFHSALVEHGKNDHMLNAEREGGPHNGVLTAVEDFLSQTNRDLLLFAQPGIGGVGVIASAAALQEDARLASAMARVHDPKFAVTISPVYATREFGEASMSPAKPLIGLRLGKRLRDVQWRVRRGRRSAVRP
jgi:hypothetical protein